MILCQRYADSTLAYQVYGKNFPRKIVEDISSLGRFPRPDLTFWLDVPVRVALDRIIVRGGKPDRFEGGQATTGTHWAQVQDAMPRGP